MSIRYSSSFWLGLLPFEDPRFDPCCVFDVFKLFLVGRQIGKSKGGRKPVGGRFRSFTFSCVLQWMKNSRIIRGLGHTRQMERWLGLWVACGSD